MTSSEPSTAPAPIASVPATALTGFAAPSQRRMVIVVGPTGSGKTEWVKHYLQGRNRVLIADAAFREFDALDFTSAGFDSLGEYLERHQRKEAFFRVSYTPYEVEYPLMCDLARVLGPIDFVVEECDRFPDPKWCQEYEEIIARGRHWGVSITALSRHPFAIPVSLRREANRIIAFRHHEPRDIDWLVDVMGEAAHKIPELAPHHYIEWTAQTGASEPRILTLKK